MYAKAHPHAVTCEGLFVVTVHDREVLSRIPCIRKTSRKGTVGGVKAGVEEVAFLRDLDELWTGAIKVLCDRRGPHDGLTESFNVSG